MKTITKVRLEKLKKLYESYEDKDSLEFLSQAESDYNDVKDIQVLREHPRMQKLIKGMYGRLKDAMLKLTTDPDMPDQKRQRYYVSKEWAIWFLDQVGEDEEKINKAFDDIIESYAKKAKLE